MIFCLHCRKNFTPKGDEGCCSPWCALMESAREVLKRPKAQEPKPLPMLHVDMDWLRREIAMANYEYEQRQLGGPYKCDACGYHTRTIYFYRQENKTLLLCPASLRKIDPDYYREMVASARENEVWKARQRWEAEHASDWMDVKSGNGDNLYTKRRIAKFQAPPQDAPEAS